MRKMIFMLALMASQCLWAQTENFTMMPVTNRAPAPAEGYDAPIKKAASRRAAKVTWSYPTSTPATPFAAGTGTDADPYQIATAQQLANMAYMVNTNSSYRSKSYKLIADITLNEDLLNEDRSLKAVGAAWTPIGSTSKPFTGKFNGDDHVIKGIYVYSTGTRTGLFGYASNATFENVGMVDGYLYGCCHLGAIVGDAVNTTIQNCYNTCTIYTRSSCNAGIAGLLQQSSKVIACYNEGFIYSYGQSCSHGYNGNCVGGIAGAVDRAGVVSYCYNAGSVYGGAHFVGGICSPWYPTGPTAISCHNVGAVSCYDATGTGSIIADDGTYGYPLSPTFTNSYALEGSSPYNVYTTGIKTASEFADGTVLSLIDADGKYFKQGLEYPILNYQPDQQQEVKALYEGVCGDNAWWKITEDGELIIGGYGPMYDYGDSAIVYIQKTKPAVILAGIQKYGLAMALQGFKTAAAQDMVSLGLAPWVNYSEIIKKITVQEGVTTIAQGAFLLLTSVTQATLPSTITEVGSGAFAFCVQLAQLYCYAVEPPAMTGLMKDYTFCYTSNVDVTNYNNPKNGILYVPTTSATKYAAADGWKLWTNTDPSLTVVGDPVLALTDTETKLVADSYKAGNVSYTRTGQELAVGNYVSLCLPFDVNLAEATCIKAAYLPLDFVFYSEQTGLLTLSFAEETGVIPAGTPFLAELSGSELSLKSAATIQLTGYETPIAQKLKVFNYTNIGGIMKQNQDIAVTWDGTFTQASAANTWMFSTDGTMTAATTAAPFRTLVKAAGSVEIKGINAIGVGQQTSGVLGDLNGDGKVDVTDLTCLGNLILYGKMNPNE